MVYQLGEVLCRTIGTGCNLGLHTRGERERDPRSYEKPGYMSERDHHRGVDNERSRRALSE